MLKLYSYFRSSAAYRVRIALNVKGLDHDYEAVHLMRDGGGQRAPAYRAINPMGHVPALDHDGFRLGESLAILSYLEEIFPRPALWPGDPRARARVWQICELINSGIQPLVNLKVTARLKELGLPAEQVEGWSRHWIEDGLANLDALVREASGHYACGDEVTAADCLIVPQCFSARRFGVDVDRFPAVARVDARARLLDAFVRAEPARQPDAE